MLAKSGKLIPFLLVLITPQTYLLYYDIIYAAFLEPGLSLLFSFLSNYLQLMLPIRKKKCIFKRLRLVKTTSWQHRFLDLTNLAPMWLRTYEYMKSTLQTFFFSFKQGFQIGFFRFGQKFSNQGFPQRSQ